MDKDIILKRLVETLLFLVAIIVIIYAYHTYVQSSLEQGIDVLSGATQNYNI